MTSYDTPMRALFGCLVGAGVGIGLVIAAILWWLSRS